MNVSALPLYQPWATLVATGAKRVETRHWPAPARLIGQPIAIYATKSLERGGESGLFELCSTEPFRSALLSAGAQLQERGRRSRVEGLARGALIGSVVIDRCSRMTRESIAVLAHEQPNEHAFGYYAVGRYAWVLRDAIALPEPVPWTTKSQGIFYVPASAIGLEPPQDELPIGEAA